MGFKLETAGGLSSHDPTSADLLLAFDSDAQRGEFIILHAPDGSFMQAAGEGSGPYILEHRARSGAHIVAMGELTKAQVQEAFLIFLNGDNKWQTKWQWEPLKKKAGCLSAGMIVALVGAVVYAVK